LFARDDGSKDNTLGILTEYAQRYPKRIHVVDDVKENLGAGRSFMHLLEVTDADYYMFSDQDDVWMPDKIERTLRKLREVESQWPAEAVGVFTDLTVVDKDLNVLMPSLWKGDNRHPEYTRDFYKQWVNRHATYGCTQMMNKVAKGIVLPYHQFEGVQGAHDNWVEYVLIKKGHYDYLEEATILYRQHGSNVVGANFGHTIKDETQEMTRHPISLLKKIKKDYKRMKQMPFYVSFLKVLWYRIHESIMAIF
jgi:glycosyltransferase involved in cell wall biosynthesis